MANGLKLFLFAAGVSLAGAGVAYVTGLLDPWLQQQPPQLTAETEDLTPQPAALTTEAEPEDAEAETPVTQTPVAEEPVVTAPEFDIVRVEPDGSMVIAGRAAPRSLVEVLTGRRVLAVTQAGPDGDFAAILDEPLEPGDYQIVLRSTSEDGSVVASSVQTAIVSVPETPDGQVLALVEEPGSASRLITVPVAEPVASAEETAEAEPAEEQIAAADEPADAGEPAVSSEDEAQQTEIAAAEPTEPATEEDVAEVPATEEDVAEVPATEEDVADAAATETEEQVVTAEEAVEPAQPTVATDEDAAAETEIASDEPVTADEDVAETASPEAGEQDLASADEPVEPVEETVAAAEDEASEAEIAAEQPADATSEDEVAAADAAEPEAEQEVASLPEQPSTETEAPAPAMATRVFVEAVEIDGDTVFVAGQAEPGRFLRVYANEILLGETRASEGGRFLIEARVDLPVGDYIIRADLLGSDGSVEARAAVPFEREPGDAIAAVAPPAVPQTPLADEEAEIASEEPAEAAQEEEIAEVETTAPSSEEAAAEEPAAPAESEVAAAEEVEAASEDDIAEADISAPSATEGAADEPAMPAESEVAADEPAMLAQEEVTEAEATDPAPSEIAAEEPVAPAETEVATDEQPAVSAEPETEQMAAVEPIDETVSPALQRVDGAVIIRRGDNLWRISRRVYGQGIRFSTIYLANQDQISNPDRIWPGQVFTVPAETEDGAVADLEALGEQAVDPSEVPGEIIR
ncbi:MAG: LysM peptidoglycan-binding domain-containing protein [Aliihoeflea sp.]